MTNKLINIAPQALVVLDLNILEGASSLTLPKDVEVVVPQGIIHEIAHSSRGECFARGLIQKFQEFCRQNVAHVWAGHEWHTLALAERSPYYRSIGRACVDLNTSPVVNDIQHINDHNWVEDLGSLRDSKLSGIYENKRRFFLRWCEMIEMYTIQNAPAVFKELNAGKIDYERIKEMTEDGAAIANIAPTMGPGDKTSFWKTNAWKKAIRSSPNRFAVGRWCRIMFWYGLLWCAGRTSDFGNHWDDTQYLFLASYTGHLATSDKILRTAAQSLWPKINLLDQRQLLSR